MVQKCLEMMPISDGLKVNPMTTKVTKTVDLSCGMATLGMTCHVKLKVLLFVNGEKMIHGKITGNMSTSKTTADGSVTILMTRLLQM